MTATPASPPPAKRRDPWLDNVKMVLVTIVVIGHLLVVSPPSRQQSWVYDFIYYFHIPAFVLVTGYLSRSFRYTRRHLLSVLTTLVVPYIIFSWLMVWWRHLAGGEPLLDQIWTNPHWPMWYLIVTAMWRLVTPILKLHWVMVPISIAVSLLAGLTDQELFDLNRFMGFLPFFVVGLHLRPEHLALLRSPRAKAPALVVVALVFWLAKYTDRYWSTQFLFFRADYASLGATFGEGVWIRIRLICVALAMTAAVLALIPQRRSFLTQMGGYSLVVYLCHGFVVRWLEYQGWADLLPVSHPWLAIAINVCVAIALALVLAWRPIAERLLWIVDPINTFLKHRRLQAEASQTAA
ncbi:acyltransferase family protein [Nocardioides sp.]|uniref:acyltransferase family protein n=1 Tax=Nocardioides sp. TaxID=35761 RepID=UPI003527805A